MEFTKYHALGNDYLVLNPSTNNIAPDHTLSQADIQQICHRNLGLGSDGILYGPLPSTSADFKLRILNPDGSEAEKSGNGLRIFARYLFDQKHITTDPVTIETLGGIVTATILDSGQQITVDMGPVSFHSEKIPVKGPPREVVNETLELNDQKYKFYAATIGNPHAIFPLPNISPELAKILGPKIETHGLFPNKTNVQFLKILDSRNIQIEIWERGAGYTLASGSSSSAAAAVAVKMGQCQSPLTVHMPGGKLLIEINNDYSVRMTGPVTFVAKMTTA